MVMSRGYYKTVATLLIAHKRVAKAIVRSFEPNEEIDGLIALRFRDLLTEFDKIIPESRKSQARNIFPESTIELGYVYKYLIRNRQDICKALARIPDEYRLICQVEVPKLGNTRYKNIDIGFSSNGKRMPIDSSLLGCSIRETYEETQYLPSIYKYKAFIQYPIRSRLSLEDLPLSFAFERVFCYILFI
jgi:hypothetical protein